MVSDPDPSATGKAAAAAPGHAAGKMAATCRRWNLAVLSFTLAIATGSAALNYSLNIFGVFGNAAGLKLVVYDNERTSKYLFSYNYIPANFDALLVGTSISDNWDTSRLTCMRLYNGSISGGNISEEALVAENVLLRSRPKLVMFVIHPYLTETSGRKSGYMNKQEYWGALGSIQLLRAYWNKWLVERGTKRQEFSEYGQDDFELHPVPVDRKVPAVGDAPLHVDARALKEYADLLARARSRGARIIGIIPPVEEGLGKANGQSYQAYYRQIRPLFLPSEPIIDFNNGDFDALRNQPSNFQDKLHLSRPAANQVMDALNKKVKTLDQVEHWCTTAASH